MHKTICLNGTETIDIDHGNDTSDSAESGETMGNGDDTISCSGDDTAYLCASCGCGSYTERTVELPDDFTYQYIQCTGCSRVEYTLGQAQALIEYSREHLFLFVED